jgi:hypothetical protein
MGVSLFTARARPFGIELAHGFAAEHGRMATNRHGHQTHTISYGFF